MTKISLRKIPILSHTLTTVESNTKNYGLTEALRRLSAQVNTKLSSQMSPATRKVLAKERVVLIGNHPTDTEPFALFASLPNRQSVKLIVSDCMVNLSRVIDEHLIPVHIRVSQIHNPVGWRPTAFLVHSASEKRKWTSEEAHDFNVKQMRRASQDLAKGNMIMIFPGKRAKDGHWFPGVGHLIHDAQTKQSIYAVFAYVTGTSRWDFARLIPLAGKVMPHIHVEYSEPIKVNALQKKSSKEIAYALEMKYETWLCTKTPSNTVLEGRKVTPS